MIEIKEIRSLEHLDLLAKKIVEGYLIGLHKSPYHGFSAEFREHRIFNSGDPIKSIDQKVLARTDRLYVKKFDEETNLRCHLVLDVSPSMFYPKNEKRSKADFSMVAIASLMHLLKKQRDAYGLITFSNQLHEVIAPKLTESNRQRIFATFDKYIAQKDTPNASNILESIQQLAHHINKRGLIVIFTDFFDSNEIEDFDLQFSKSIQQLLFKKHEIVIFHVLKNSKEIQFDFENKPTEFIDIESGESVRIPSMAIQMEYQKTVSSKIEKIKNKCRQIGVDFVSVDIDEDYKKILETFLRKRAKIG
jgi:uncharacterized protein (DUF58 family)